MRKMSLLVPNVRGGIGAPSNVTGAWDEKVRQMPGVINVARADGVLGSNNAVNGVGFAPTNSHISLNFIRVDYDFIPTMEIALSAGRNFSRDFVSDSTAIIINQEAVRQLGLQEPVIGQRLAWDDEAGKTHDVTIVGIAKDFHFTNLHTAISPFGFILEVGNGSNFFIRVGSTHLASTLANIEQVWSLHNPGKPFEYSFQDQYIADLHLNDERFAKLFSVFTIAGDSHRLSGTLRPYRIPCRIENKGNRRKKNIGCFCAKYSQAPVTGICCDDRDVVGHCISSCLLPNEVLASEFCLSDRYRMAGVCICRGHFDGTCGSHDKFSCN